MYHKTRPIVLSTNILESNENINIGFIIYRENSSKIYLYINENISIFRHIDGLSKFNPKYLSDLIKANLLKSDTLFSTNAVSIKVNDRKVYQNRIYLGVPGQIKTSDFDEGIEEAESKYMRIIACFQKVRLEGFIVNMEQKNAE